MSECFNIPVELKSYFSDYRINVFDIAYLSDEQVSLFKSDFRIVADYFVQMRKNRTYSPSKDTIKHVDEVLKLMSVLTEDTRFENVQRAEGKVDNMCQFLDEVEAKGVEKGEFKMLVKLVSDGTITIQKAAETAGMDEDAFKRKMKEV